MKKSRKIILTILIIIILSTISIYFIINHHRAMQEERVRQEEEQLRGEQSIYIHFLRFHNNIQSFWGDYLNLRTQIDQPKLVFVMSEDCVSDYPDDLAVFWPSLFSLLIMDEINILSAEGLIDLEDFYLTYPLTAEDLVYNWESVRTLLWTDHPDPIEGLGLRSIIDHADDYVRHEYRRRVRTELELLYSFLGDIDIGDYDIEFPIDRIGAENAVALYELYQAEIEGHLYIPTILEEITRMKLLMD